MSDGLHIPAYSDLLWPTLRAVREIGNSGTNEEIVERVIANEGFTEEQLTVPANNGRSGLIEYRLAWARSYLKDMALLENSRRGVWSTTDLGRTITPEGIPAAYATYTAQLRETQRRYRGLPGVAQLPGVLPVQALRRQRRLRRGARLPWGHERARREGSADHDGHLHLRSQARVHP